MVLLTDWHCLHVIDLPIPFLDLPLVLRVLLVEDIIDRNGVALNLELGARLLHWYQGGAGLGVLHAIVDGAD